VIFTANEILARGPSLVGYDRSRQENISCDTNLKRFRSHYYGSNPIVYAQIWEDLQTTEIEEAKISGAAANTGLDYFLMSIHFLKCYPTTELQAS
jgi:hypothetical protein